MISILLSTYHGAPWLPTLLDSLIGQDLDECRIIIRDDGSTDSTGEIIRAAAEEYDHIEAHFGPNLGVNRSFFTLLHLAAGRTGYAAFCDQDDRWEIDKLSRAIALLEEQSGGGPAMYCSRLTLAAEDLTAISLSRPCPRGPSFANALVENIATGATMVLNREAIELLDAHEPDFDRVVMYDWWIYQTIAAFGTVVFDPESRIVSRQHRGNVVGLPFGRRYWRAKAGFLASGDRHLITTQAEEFARVFADRLGPDERGRLEEFLASTRDGNLRGRWRYARSGRVFRQRPLDDLFLRIRIATGAV
jgi:glycosyltransferase involved in cell wall biosynthesis